MVQQDGVEVELEASQRAGIAEDEATRPLVQMRIARKRLLALLQARLRAQPCAVEPPPLPSMYPALDALPTEELLAWGERPW